MLAVAPVYHLLAIADGDDELARSVLVGREPETSAVVVRPREDGGGGADACVREVDCVVGSTEDDVRLLVIHVAGIEEGFVVEDFRQRFTLETFVLVLFREDVDKVAACRPVQFRIDKLPGVDQRQVAWSTVHGGAEFLGKDVFAQDAFIPEVDVRIAVGCLLEDIESFGEGGRDAEIHRRCLGEVIGQRGYLENQVVDPRGQIDFVVQVVAIRSWRKPFSCSGVLSA